MIIDSYSGLNEGDYVLGSDHEGNQGVFVFSKNHGFFSFCSNPMGNLVKWEKIKINPRTLEFFRLDGSKVNDQDIFE